MRLSVDLTKDNPMEAPWIIRSANVNKSNREINDALSMASSYLHASVLSSKSKRMHIDNIITEQEQVMDRVKKIDDILKSQNGDDGKSAKQDLINRVVNQHPAPMDPIPEVKIETNKIEKTKLKPTVVKEDAKTQSFNVKQNSEEIDLLQKLLSKPEMLNEIIRLSQMMIDAKIDFRILEFVKRGVNKEYDEDTTEIPISSFHKYWRNLIKPEVTDLDPAIEDKVLHFVTTKDGNQVDKQKLISLIDFYQYYPVYVQKDRNFSKEMYYVMSSNTDGGYQWKGGLKKQQVDNMQNADMHGLLDYINDKIKEKYPKISQAYRFFDIDHKSVLTREEFHNGLKKLKLNDLPPEKIDQVFDFCDKNKDGLLTYNEFCFLLEDKYKNLDPFGAHNNIYTNQGVESAIKSDKSAKTFTKRETLEDYKETSATQYKPFFKTNKKMYFLGGMDKSFHGIATLPSDNIKNIVNHGFEKDYLETKEKRDQDKLIKILMKEENVRGQETKASIMRNQAIKDKIEKGSSKPNAFKLKQFDEAKPTTYISETTKDIRKRYKDSMKKSNIETDSVLKIAELTSQAQKQSEKDQSESKKMYIGDEVEQLKAGGNEIYSYDISTNQIM